MEEKEGLGLERGFGQVYGGEMMMTQDIPEYIGREIEASFRGFTTESGEIMTSESGDGRFFGKVVATRYGGLGDRRDLFLAIGETGSKLQRLKLVKLGCVAPDRGGLDALLLKELGIVKPE